MSEAFSVSQAGKFRNFSFGIEERYGAFPFTLDEQFKLAIGITDTGFKFAVNGEFFGRFGYRTENPLPLLNGLKFATGNGMHLAITEVDHIVTGTPDCDDIVTMSHADNVID